MFYPYPLFRMQIFLHVLHLFKGYRVCPILTFMKKWWHSSIRACQCEILAQGNEVQQEMETYHNFHKDSYSILLNRSTETTFQSSHSFFTFWILQIPIWEPSYSLYSTVNKQTEAFDNLHLLVGIGWPHHDFNKCELCFHIVFSFICSAM